MGAGRIVVVDDRRRGAPLSVPAGVVLLRSGGRGPAAARNLGWRAAPRRGSPSSTTTWSSMPDWGERLAEDLARLAPDVAGSQGRVRVPLPAHRRPTDWERNVAGPERRALDHRRPRLPPRRAGRGRRLRRALSARVPRGLRPGAAGHGRRLGAGPAGARGVAHPVGPPARGCSVRKQAGNADDVLMRRLHGRGWRERAGAPRGRRARHLATTAPAPPRSALLLAGRPRAPPRSPRAGAWPPREFAWARIAPGPRDRARGRHDGRDQRRCIPPQAAWHYLRGRRACLRRDRPGAARPARPPCSSTATARWCVDVPYNGDPERVRPVRRRARAALDRLRAAGVRVGVVTNQSGVGRGLITRRAGRRGQRARRASCSARSTPCRSARTAPTTAAPAASRAPGMVLDGCAALGVDARALRRHRRHRRRRRGRGAPPARAAILVPNAAHPRRGDRRGARGRAPTSARRRRPAAGGRAVTRTCSSPGWTTPATCCWPGPPVRAVAAGATRVTLLCGPAGAEAAAAAARRRRGRGRRRASGSRPDPPAGRPRRRRAPRSTSSPRSARTRALILTSFHQSPLPAGAAAADGRRAPDRRDQRGLPRRAARRPPPRAPTTSPRPERGAVAGARAGLRRCPPATTAALRVRRPGRLRPPADRLRRRASRRLGARARLGRRSGHADAGRARWPPRAGGCSVTGAPGERALTASRRGRPRRCDLGGRTTLAELAALLAGAGCDRGRQHRARAPGRRASARRSSRCSPRRSRPSAGARGGCRTSCSHVAVPCAGCRARDVPGSRAPVPRRPAGRGRRGRGRPALRATGRWRA